MQSVSRSNTGYLTSDHYTNPVPGQGAGGGTMAITGNQTRLQVCRNWNPRIAGILTAATHMCALHVDGITRHPSAARARVHSPPLLQEVFFQNVSFSLALIHTLLLFLIS